MKNNRAIQCLSLYSVYFLCLLIVFSCSPDPKIPVYGDFPTEVAEIFANKCATSGCHNDASYKGASNLNLTSFHNLFLGSSSGSPVIPYRSDFSSLVYFINTYSDLGPINQPTMPLNGKPLSKNEVLTIKKWIDQGAPDINGHIMWSDGLNRKKYYVLNQGCDVVTVFDADTQLPIRYINVGNNPSVAESPHMIRVSPDGKYWYVIFVANHILQKYSTDDDALVGEISLGNYQDWNTIAISNDGKRAYCVSWNSNSRLAVVDLEHMKLLHNIGGGSFSDAHGVALNQSNDTLYITRQTGNYIYKIDTSLTAILEVTLDNSKLPNPTSLLDPHEITFSPDGKTYFVSCQKSNEVRVMKTAGDLLIKVIQTGKYPLEFAKSIKHNQLFVTCQDEPSLNINSKGCVTAINMTTYQAQNYPVGYQPHGIGVDDVRDLLIVASRNILSSGPAPHHTGVCGRNGFVNYLDLNTMNVLSKKTEVASDPYSIAVKP